MFKLKRSLFLTMLCVSILVNGCKPKQPNASSYEAELIASVKTYYDAEKTKDWKKCFSMRNAEFRYSTDPLDYEKTMSTQTEGWELVDYKVLDVSINKGSASVQIDFEELSPEGFAPKEISGGQSRIARFKHETKWVRQGNVWFVVDAGTRAHISYNAAIAPP
jgi:hypothetical protein